MSNVRERRLQNVLSPLAAIALLGAIFAISAPSANAQTAQYATVTTALNMRSGPSTSYQVILVLPAGAQVTVYQCTTNRTWCELEYNGRLGWASARYLRFQTAVSGDPPPQQPAPPPQTGQVTAQTTVSLNMRSGPSTQYGVIAVIPAGGTVAVSRCTNGYAWCEVTYGNRTGWVSARYLRATSPQYSEQPLANIAALLGLRLFEFIVGQVGGQQPPQQPPQQQTPGPNEVCFYRDFNYQGPVACVSMGQNNPSLGNTWNDQISSIRVGSNARVEICRDVNYGGDCRIVTGNIAVLPGDMNDAISSFRTTQIGAGTPPPGGPPPFGQACFYADFNFQGASFCLAVGSTVPFVDPAWNDRISSIRVGPGVRVEACQHAGFEGWCENYNGNVAQLPPVRNDEISSIRVR